MSEVFMVGLVGLCFLKVTNRQEIMKVENYLPQKKLKEGHRVRSNVEGAAKSSRLPHHIPLYVLQRLPAWKVIFI